MTTAELPIAQFRVSLQGQLIEPHEVDYQIARSVYNGMIDKCPALIVRCATETDVVTSVNFAREHDLLLAIKGGGHNGAGLGVCQEGLVIDLSPMKHIEVNPDERTVRVQGGCLLRELDAATHAHGLAVPTGINGTTGVAGLTLGGGLGYLTRQCGLTIDNLLEADIVLADGRVVKASATEHADLFWAIRGGGGNFGVVTSFLFRTHPISTVVAGPMLWNLDDARDILRWYRTFIKEAPDTLNGWFAFLTVPPGPPFPEELHLKKMCGIVWCYSGPPEEAESVFEPIRQIKKPVLEMLGPMPVPVMQGMFDALYPPGLQWYWKGDYVNELSDEVIELHLNYGEALPSMLSTMHLYPINGAASRVCNHATAWGYRDATWAMVIAGVDPDPANKDAITNWARDYWQALHPFSAGGSYINFMMEEGEDRVKATYGDNYPRLAAIKAKFDPDNLFRVNQNIRPQAG
ncbi:FAD-binding oxidoreductase [Spirosoma endbachense]|uniref:FAD-binding protein n=1 Tax=Spirosoma endbachense TaxID=2666025 RepID=A0A6P1W4A4_9BACT|nr:FAD-binding oxidoreductase [Spirosoma endbachense]QHV99724.1 FAD-binding protein [Spirosoma endbachense]